MSVDPSTLADGTVCEASDGTLSRKTAGGFALDDGLRLYNPVPFGVALPIVRTFSPDPLPSQEVPRDQWATIQRSSRVRVVEVNGDQHDVTFAQVRRADLESRTVLWRLIDLDRVFLLDEPADPDADLIERIARALAKDAGIDHSDGTKPAEPFLSDARIALTVVREQEATS